MGYEEIYTSYKGRSACSRRGAYWRQHEPYCFLVDKEKKVAYALNRYYKRIGQDRDVGWINYPDVDGTDRIYLYNDGTRPFDNMKYCRDYITKVEDVKAHYRIVYDWD